MKLPVSKKGNYKYNYVDKLIKIISYFHLCGRRTFHLIVCAVALCNV